MWKLKDFREQIENTFGKFTVEELKVREATDEKPWAPDSQLMHEIADMTFNNQSFDTIMNMLFFRVVNEPTKSWRRVYKGLIVLEHLVKNGSDKVINFCRQNKHHLMVIQSYKFVDADGKEQTINITHRLKELLSLVEDDDRLIAERKTAKELRNRLNRNPSISNKCPVYEPNKISTTGSTIIDAISETFDKIQKVIPTANIFGRPRTDDHQPSTSTQFHRTKQDFHLNYSQEPASIKIFRDSNNNTNTNSVKKFEDKGAPVAQQQMKAPAAKVETNLLELEDIFTPTVASSTTSATVFNNVLENNANGQSNQCSSDPLNAFEPFEPLPPANTIINTNANMNIFTGFNTTQVNTPNTLHQQYHSCIVPTGHEMMNINKNSTKPTRTTEDLISSNLEQFLTGSDNNTKKNNYPFI